MLVKTYGVKRCHGTRVDASNVQITTSKPTDTIRAVIGPCSHHQCAGVFLVKKPAYNSISTGGRAEVELTAYHWPRTGSKEYSKSGLRRPLGFRFSRSRLQAGDAVAAFDFRGVDRLKVKVAQAISALRGFAVLVKGGSLRWLCP